MPAPTAAATDVEALLALATSALQSGQPANAIPFLRDVARRRPEAALIHHDLGLACLETGLLDEAVIALKRAVTINPRYPEGHLHLGVVLERLGDTAAALSAYHHTTALAPSLTEAWYRSGALVYLLGHHDVATECFVRARESGPTTKFGRLAAARALLGKGRDTEGERALRKLIAADPNDALAHDLLGNLLAEAGRFTEAIDSFQCAIAISPWMAGCYYDLVRCRRITADDAGLIADMQQALDIPGLVPEHRVRVHLALGKAAEDLRDYPRAMDHFTAANAARTATATFDSAQFDREITRLIEQTAPALVARASQLGNPDATPILIIGMPRSGTTLLEQIISSHPAVHGAGELNYWASYGAHWQQRDLTGNPTAFLQKAAFNYVRLLKSIAPRALRVTDKMPFNFLWAGLIHLALPKATIIHCRRSPLDTALSIQQTAFEARLNFPTGGEKLVAYFKSYQRLMNYWQAVLPSDRFIEVDYEALTSNPEPMIRRVIDACGLDWNALCLTPHLNARAVKTPSKWQTRQPINAASIERWRHYEHCLGALGALRANSLE